MATEERLLARLKGEGLNHCHVSHLGVTPKRLGTNPKHCTKMQVCSRIKQLTHLLALRPPVMKRATNLALPTMKQTQPWVLRNEFFDWVINLHEIEQHPHFQVETSTIDIPDHGPIDCSGSLLPRFSDTLYQHRSSCELS
jgi:hypothetical protein